MLLASHHSYADQVKSISAVLNSNSFDIFNQSRESIDAKMQSCKTDKNAVVTIYSATGKAQVGIDVKLDGSPVGNLTTHFPDKGPKCKTPGSAGIITIVIPAGKHTLEAESLNLVWPSHTFTINKCECLVLPLS
ncbi:MAG: hypothetical protein LJE83_01630 [Gammaproteobacteria bacterium]|nr:hypothetical protein [Gammaproteobacteria bacterium]